MAKIPIDELDAAGVLAAADDALLRRRAAEVEDLQLIVQWADLHATDPRCGPGGRRNWCGDDRLVEIGGDGTPLVQELCLPELHAHRDLVPHLPTDASRDELRAEAFGWLAHPERVLELLEPPADDSQRRPRRARAVVYVHLHEAALHRRGVARVEELGPLLLDQVRRLLGHAHVDLKPVIDLQDRTRVNAYEHPESIKERVHLRTVGEVFPHAARVSRAVDLDHPDEYDEHGPPGQTGDHHAAPLGRTNHRARTHLGYRVRQLGPESHLWRTSHGLHRHVDHAGTHVIDAATARDMERAARIQRALDEFERRLGLTG